MFVWVQNIHLFTEKFNFLYSAFLACPPEHAVDFDQ